ncbi:MAG: SRPBCC domain-containing protein [Myxococcota bacterium]
MNSKPTPEPVIVERRYRARLEEVWELWTTKDGFESWWGPEGFRVEVHAMEPRVGGPLVYDMIASDPEAIAAMKAMGQPVSHPTRGWFSALEPMKRLILMHSIDFIGGVEPYDHTIEVELEPSGHEVRMIVRVHPHRDPHWTKMSLEGFTSQLKKLDRRFSL